MIKCIRTLVIVSIVFFVVIVIPQLSFAQKPNIDKVTITYVKFPLNVPIIIAKYLNLFETEFSKDSIPVEWAEITAGPKQVQAMAGGSVQFASAISADAVITAKANDMDIKVIGVFARAPKAFNIMTKNPEIQSVQDLKGRVVAGAKGSLLNQLLFAALLDAGMKTSDVQFVGMPGAQALAAMLSGSVDAGLVAGPGAVRAQAEGARVIANGDGLVRGLILIAMDGQLLKKNPRLTERYLMVHNQALKFMLDHPEETYKVVAEETGISETDVRRIYPDYNFNPQIMDADIVDMITTQEFLEQYGMMLKSFDINDLIHQ